MKKLICMICILAMVLSLAACGQVDKPAEPSGTTAPTTSESSPTEPSAPVEPTEPSEPAGTIPENPTPPSEDNAEENEEAIPPVTEPDEEDEQTSEPAEPAVPSEPVEPSKPAEKPAEPTTKPTEPTTKPSEPATKPTTPTNPPEEAEDEEPAACTHKNTKFVEDFPPPTCMEYGYYDATICSDCGKVVNYRNYYHYVKSGTTALPTEHIAIYDDLGYIEPTPTTEGYSGDRACYTCGTIFEKGHVLPKTPYFVGFELVSESRPNAYIVDGTDLLSRLFGPHRAYQTGDSVTYRIVMSDGGTTGFEYNKLNDNDTSFDYVVKGNFVTITFKHCNRWWGRNSHFAINTMDKNGNEIIQSVGADYLIATEENIAECIGKGEYDMDLLLREFAFTKGMWFTYEREYLANYTNDNPALSIYGTESAYFSDMVPITGNPNWVSEIIALIEEYSRRGFNLAYWEPLESGRVSCRVGYSAEWLAKIEKDYQGIIRSAGLTLLTNPEAVPSYTAGAPSKSVTGTGDGYYDDVIVITGNQDWLTDLYLLSNEYDYLGYNVAYMTSFENGWIGLRAGYDPQWA